MTSFLFPGKKFSPVHAFLSGLLVDEDYQDLFFSSGAEAFHEWRGEEGPSLELRGRWEEQRSATDVVSADPVSPRFRAVMEVDEGLWRSLEAGLVMPTPYRDLTFKASGLLGRFEGETFGDLSGELTLDRRWLTRGLEFKGALKGGALSGKPPRQALFLLGGRGTIPGYSFRSRVGDQYWLLQAVGSRDILAPWVRLRAFGYAGGTRYGGPPLPGSWPQDTSPSLLLSTGFGLGLGWDVLHLDLARGLREGGEWEFILSVNRSFWAWL